MNQIQLWESWLDDLKVVADYDSRIAGNIPVRVFVHLVNFGDPVEAIAFFRESLSSELVEVHVSHRTAGSVGGDGLDGHYDFIYLVMSEWRYPEIVNSVHAGSIIQTLSAYLSENGRLAFRAPLQGITNPSMSDVHDRIAVDGYLESTNQVALGYLDKFDQSKIWEPINGMASTPLNALDISSSSDSTFCAQIGPDGPLGFGYDVRCEAAIMKFIEREARQGFLHPCSARVRKQLLESLALDNDSRDFRAVLDAGSSKFSRIGSHIVELDENPYFSPCINRGETYHARIDFFYESWDEENLPSHPPHSGVVTASDADRHADASFYWSGALRPSYESISRSIYIECRAIAEACLDIDSQQYSVVPLSKTNLHARDIEPRYVRVFMNHVPKVRLYIETDEFLEDYDYWFDRFWQSYKFFLLFFSPGNKEDAPGLKAAAWKFLEPETLDVVQFRDVF